MKRHATKSCTSVEGSDHPSIQSQEEDAVCRIHTVLGKITTANVYTT